MKTVQRKAEMIQKRHKNPENPREGAVRKPTNSLKQCCRQKHTGKMFETEERSNELATNSSKSRKLKRKI